MNSNGFKLGRLLMTAGVAAREERDIPFTEFVVNSLKRFSFCDWGDMCKEDAEMNDLALKNGDDRILASYEYPSDPDGNIWIITEWDHSATTILFPDEY